MHPVKQTKMPQKGLNSFPASSSPNFYAILCNCNGGICAGVAVEAIGIMAK